MNKLALIAGTIAVFCAFAAQYNGWGYSADSVFHHLWWATAGGGLIVGGLFND